MENRRDRGRRLATGALAHMASRKAAAVAAAILLLAFPVLVWTNASPAENGAGGETAAHAWRESEEASGKDGGAGSGTQSDASEASEPAAKGDQSEEASASREEATRKGAGSSDNSGNKSNSSSKKDGKTDSKPNGGNSNSSSSGSNSGGSSKKDDTPAHIHKYDIYHPAVTHTETVHHPAVTHTESRSICNGCGADITGNERSHAKAAALAGNYACGSCHSEPRTVTDSAAWDETVTVTDSPAYYTCSCGATK